MARSKAHQHLFGLLVLSFWFTQLGICVRPPGIMNGQDLISEACKNTLYFDVCVSSLHSDPRSHIVDFDGLAAIELDLALIHSSDTVLHLRTLNSHMNGTDDTYMVECLNVCMEEYSDAVENLRQSVDALGEKSYESVNDLVTAAMTDSDTCEEAFMDKPGYVSPLTERNEYFQKLCSNSLAITKLLA